MTGLSGQCLVELPFWRQGPPAPMPQIQTCCPSQDTFASVLASKTTVGVSSTLASRRTIASYSVLGSDTLPGKISQLHGKSAPSSTMRHQWTIGTLLLRMPVCQTVQATGIVRINQIIEDYRL